MRVWHLTERDFSRNVRRKGVLRYVRMMIAVLWNPSFMTTFWYRLAHENYPPIGLFLKVVSHYINIFTGIQIEPDTEIGEGIRFPHYGCIVINHESIIGKNCTIMQGVTIGRNVKGSPEIGNNVLIGANATIIGKLKIGNMACIGAGSVVTKDIPEKAVVVGNPARIISMDGDRQNKDY